MPLSPRSLAPIIENAFPINGLNKETFDNLNLYIPDPDFCYSDTIGVNKTPKDGNVAMWLNKKQPNTQMVVGSLTSDVGWSIVQPTNGGVTFSSNGVRINSVDGSIASINTGWFAGSAVKALILGNSYRLRFKAVMVSGIIQITDSAANIYANITTSGTFEILFTATATTTFMIKRNGVCDGTISNLSITDLGVSLVQTVAGKQPKLRKGSKNWVLNSSLTGFVTGTPGTVPSNWNYSNPTGISRQIVAVGSELVNGVNTPYVDVRFFGTATSNGNISLGAVPPTAVLAYVGQQWVSSIWVKLIAGTMPAGYSLSIDERNSSWTYLTGDFILNYTINNNYNKVSFSRTLSNASVAMITSNLIFIMVLNTSYDFTIRIAAPQLELGTNVTSDTFVLTNGSPASNGVGNWWLDFDGVQTSMIFNEVNYDYTQPLFIGYSGISFRDSAWQSGINLGNRSAQFPYLTVGITNIGRSHVTFFDSIGNNVTPLSSTTDSNKTIVSSGFYNLTNLILRNNGIQINNLTVTNIASSTLNSGVIGATLRQNQYSDYYNGRIFSVFMVKNIILTNTEIFSIESYIGKLAGVSI